MAEPKIAQKSPFVIDMEGGKHWWCACGRSSNQPFCDGSHKGTGIIPVKVELSENNKIAFCGCKHSSNKPFCDGTHTKL